MDFYILTDDKKTVAVTLDEYVKWRGGRPFTDPHRVSFDTVGRINVSTVFLGMDIDGDLFETLYYIGEQDYITRYKTYEEARRGHDEIVERLRKEQGYE